MKRIEEIQTNKTLGQLYNSDNDDENDRKVIRGSLLKHDFTILLDHKFAPRWLFSRNNLDSIDHEPSIFGDIYCFIASKELIPISTKKTKWVSKPILAKQGLANPFIEKKTKHEN